MWTGDDESVRAAEADGLTVYQDDLTEDAASDHPSELDGLEYALVLGDDEALNAMVGADLSEHFGSDRVFQLPARDERTAEFYTRAQVLFDDSASHDELLARLDAGSEIVVAEAPAGTSGETDIGARLGAAGIPMFVYTPGKDLRVLTAGDRPSLEAGQELIGLIGRR